MEGVHALTDVTGFGLAGHALELARGAGVQVLIEWAAVPLLPDVAELAAQAQAATGVPRSVCAEYFAGLDYRLGPAHLAGLTEFFNRLVRAGRVPDARLAFLPAA